MFRMSSMALPLGRRMFTKPFLMINERNVKAVLPSFINESIGIARSRKSC